MNIRIISLAKFTKDDQKVINDNAPQGLWPFFIKPGPRRIASTQPRFDAAGQMEITTTSLPGVPIVLGANVVSPSAFF
jgi:hypothetical protein